MYPVVDVANTPAVEALQKAFGARDANGVMSVLKSLNAAGVASVLTQAGFDIPPNVVESGSRAFIFDAVKKDLGEALARGVDGFGLNGLRTESVAIGPASEAAVGFAAKEGGVSFRPDEFDGNFEAAQVIQSLMRSSRVQVELMGGASPVERSSLLMLAGQALKKGVQGFGVEGIEGKYGVPLSLGDLASVYRQSAVAVAQESARTGLARWAAGGPAGTLDEWVPESAQRLMVGSLTVDAAHAVVASLDSRSFETHAAQIGEHGYVSLFQAQGIDVHAPTIAQQASSLGLVIHEPNRDKGQYFGSVMGLDHRASLVRVARSEALELANKDLPAGQRRPALGDSVHMAFKGGVLSASVTERGQVGAGIGR